MISLNPGPFSERPRRILAARSWAATKGGTTWQTLPMASNGKPGWVVLGWHRRAIPRFGDALIAYDYGRFVSRDVGIAADGQVVVQDLNQWEIRIQVDTRDQTATDVPEWTTEWWGKAVARRDEGVPGSEIPQGRIVWHCLDGLARTTDWYVSRWQLAHDPDGLGVPYVWPAINGHPGYNVAISPTSLTAAWSSQEGAYRMEGGRQVAALWSEGRLESQVRSSGRLRGNKDPDDTDYGLLGYIAHTYEGLGSLWTDQEVIEHALASAKPTPDDVDWVLAGELDALNTLTSAWPVAPDLRCQALVYQVLAPERGVGVAFCDWTESGNTLTPRITVRPLQVEDITYQNPVSGATVTFPGAESAGTTVEVDLIGDHRVREDACELAEVERWTRLETIAEPIVVAMTVSPIDGSWQGRWTDAQLTSLLASLGGSGTTFGLDPVTHLWGFGRAWRGLLPEGFDSGNQPTNESRVDYRLDDRGQIVTPAFGGPYDTPPLSLTIRDDLPFQVGYDYTGPEPVPPAPGSIPANLPILVMRRTTLEHPVERYTDLATDPGVSVERQGRDLYILPGQEDGDYTRYWAYTYPVESLAVTLAVDLPHRLMLAEGQDQRKVKRLYVPGLALHLAHPGTIYGLSSSPWTGGGPLRVGGSGPYILRDDRPALAAIHHLAKSWYLNPRKTAAWALAADGTTGLDRDREDPTAWPTIGQCVTTCAYNGRTETINSVITELGWDQEAGVTSWSTSWFDRDFQEAP